MSLIGCQILNYRVTRKIDSGGMGTVYEARHITLTGNRVAIKVLHAHLYSNTEMRQRFINEAQALNKLNHDSIVRLIDFFDSGSALYMLMEYVEGTPLNKYLEIKGGRISEEEAIGFYKQILPAFVYAHGLPRPLIHRDIKPSNLIIDEKGKLKILDFGVAKIIGDDDFDMTTVGGFAGTLYYMSPEQVEGKPSDIRNDIYSLGATLYQLVTGIKPYGNITKLYEIQSAILHSVLPDARSMNNSVSQHLSDVIKKALQKDPAYRFSNCAEFLSALEIENEDPQKLPGENDETHIYYESKETEHLPGGINRKKIIIISLVFVALISAGLFFYFSGTGGKEPQDETPVKPTEQVQNPPTEKPATRTDSVQVPKKGPGKVEPPPADNGIKTITANTVTDFREKVRARTRKELVNGFTDIEVIDFITKSGKYILRYKLKMSQGGNFSGLTIVFSPPGQPCESCDNAMQKNPGSVLVGEKTDDDNRIVHLIKLAK